MFTPKYNESELDVNQDNPDFGILNISCRVRVKMAKKGAGRH